MGDGKMYCVVCDRWTEHKEVDEQGLRHKCLECGKVNSVI